MLSDCAASSGTEDGNGAYDEDGLRVVFDSCPKGPVREWRRQWREKSLRDIVRWNQTSTDVHIWIEVPKGDPNARYNESISVCLVVSFIPPSSSVIDDR